MKFNDIVFAFNHYFMNAQGDGIYIGKKEMEETPEKWLEHIGSPEEGRTIRYLESKKILALNENNSGMRLVRFGGEGKTLESLKFQDVITNLYDHQFSGESELTVLDDPFIKTYSFNFDSKKIEIIAETEIPVDLKKQETPTGLSVCPGTRIFFIQTRGFGGLASRIIVMWIKSGKFENISNFDLIKYNISEIRAMEFMGYTAGKGGFVCVGNERSKNGHSTVLNLEVNGKSGEVREVGKDSVATLNVVRFGRFDNTLYASGSDAKIIEIFY